MQIKITAYRLAKNTNYSYLSKKHFGQIGLGNKRAASKLSLIFNYKNICLVALVQRVAAVAQAAKLADAVAMAVAAQAVATK